MIKVKVKTNNHVKFTLPIPYLLLHMGGAILSSKVVWTQINKWANHHTNEQFIHINPLYTKIPKKLLRQLIKELHHHKGLILVDVKSQDGTEVTIKL